MALRWGIVAAGKICNDFVAAMQTLPKHEHQVVAVASRELSRAEEYAKRFGVPTFYEGYDKLAKDPDVEIAYIGTLNRQHYGVALLMLEHGKHVLLEKPLCINEKQARHLFEVAKRKNVFLAEGIWSRYFPSYEYVRRQLDSGVLGDIKSVTVDFGSEMYEQERLIKKELGGGTVLDIGVYVIQLCQFVFRKRPTLIKATGVLNSDGVDSEMQAELHYDEGKFAKITTTALKVVPKTAVIRGTKGELTMYDFWCSIRLKDVDGTEKTWKLPESNHKFNYYQSEGLAFEADEIRKVIRAGKLWSDKLTPQESLDIAYVEEEIRKQIGVRFPEDTF